MSPAALPTLVAIQLRTGWKALATWVVAIGASMLATTTAISRLYDTPAKIHSYAASVGAGDALLAINGRVAGIDSLGGVIANEFGFLASFAIPLMGISLVARMTRKDEEQGRLETLLAGRVGRSAPVLAAILVAMGALLLTGAALFLGLVAVGVPAVDSLLYAASMAALGQFFAAAAALVAQLVGHPRGVYATGLAAIVAAYLLRGVGDVMSNPVTWLSPLGWQEETRAFGDARWWPLLIPVLASLALAGGATAESGRRDLGSAWIRRGASSATASPFLCTPLGVALRLHRGSVAGWTAVAVVISGTFGALAQPLVDAIAGNASLADAMGAAGGAGLDAVLTMCALLLALIVGGYVVQAIGLLRVEETSGRLEARLSGPRPRWAWLGTHLLVVALGVAVVSAAGGTALALTTWWSTGDGVAGPVARAVADYLPAVCLLGALALVLFGVAPRSQPVAWLTYALAAVIAYLGDPLNLPQGILVLSPFHLVGNPPQAPVDAATLAVLGLVSLALTVGSFAGFRRRSIPQG